jgi:hypothetical protein
MITKKITRHFIVQQLKQTDNCPINVITKKITRHFIVQQLKQTDNCPINEIWLGVILMTINHLVETDR